MHWSLLAAALGLPSVPEPARNNEVIGITYDSRQAREGTVFVAIPGQHQDGHQFVKTALAQGAVVAVVERELPGVDPGRLAVVADTRAALAMLAATFYGHPSTLVPVVGILSLIHISFDHTTAAYFWRITPADDVKGFALALWAHRAGYTRAAAVFGSDVGSQSDVPTLLTAWKRLGGTMVADQRIALDSSSYETEVEQLVQSRPQVIFTEVDPQTGSTYFSELQQLHGLIPIIGTEISLEAPWLKAVSGALGAGPTAKYIEGMQPYAPPSGPAWKVYNKTLRASSSQRCV